MPRPKPRWPSASRVMSDTSGFSNWLASLLADRIDTYSSSPAGMRTPPSTTGSRVNRAGEMFTGQAYLSISSTAFGSSR